MRGGGRFTWTDVWPERSSPRGADKSVSVSVAGRPTDQRYTPSQGPGCTVADRPSALGLGRFSVKQLSGVTTA